MKIEHQTETWNREEMLNILVSMLDEPRVVDPVMHHTMTKSLYYYLSFKGEVPINFF